MSFSDRALDDDENRTDGTGSCRAVGSEPAVAKLAPVSGDPGAATDDSVARCHALIRRLRRENVRLRRSGEFFGQLAERLNQELRQQRIMLSHETARPWESHGDDRQTPPPRQGLLE
jgi:hypothetical protein